MGTRLHSFIVSLCFWPLAAVSVGAEGAAKVSLRQMPVFQFEGLDTEDLASSKLTGRAYIVQFWASWCQSCSGVSRELTELNAGSSLPILAVSLDETRTAALKAVRSGRIGDSSRRYFFDKKRALADQLGDIAIPTVLVVDGSGHIRLRFSGHFGAAQIEELRLLLKSLGGQKEAS